MTKAIPYYRILFCLFISFILASCSSSKLVKDFDKQEIPESIENLDEFQNEPKEETILDKSAKAKLEFGKQLSKLGDYEKAIAEYLKVYENENYHYEYRSKALYNLGMTYSSVLYDNRDIERAIFYLKKIINEFSLSLHRGKAFEKLENLKFELEESKSEESAEQK